MKTREEVEKLKENWKKDPYWDIEETEGFEEYREELYDFSEKQKIIANEIWEKRKKVLITTASIYPSSMSDNTENYFDGLTKRELFAAMAMQGMLASETASYNYGAQENLAVNAVKRADALLAELNKEKEDSHE